MRLIFTALLFLCTFLITQGQENFNLERISTVELSEAGNDIWGYVDASGVEYAVMGSRTNTFIWSLEDPSNPIQRAMIPGGASTWRDIKSWDDHLYVTNDGSPDGLLIIDMSMAPDSISYEYIRPDVFTIIDTSFITFFDTTETNIVIDTTVVISGQDTILNIMMDTTFVIESFETMVVEDNSIILGQCHNLYIDDDGFCYLSGCRINGANKAIIFDLNQSKSNPPIVGIHGGGGQEYSHDLYVQDNIMYSSEINAGVLTLFDVTDKANIIELGDAATTMNFTHNTWASHDGRYAFTTDERANAFVDSYDVTDPANIIRLDSYQPIETANTGVIPHNTHYLNGFLITSWYTDGVIITDATRPENMIKVGAYDTYPTAGNGFQGCWGAYPFLPSGLVLTSNISNLNGLGELNVFRPNYVRAAYLDGLVTDIDDGSVINGVEVIINNPSEMNLEMTDALGEYKTGIASAGTYDVTFNHPNYLPETLSVTIENGVTTILNAQLTRRTQVTVTGNVIDATTGQVIPNSKIKLSNESRTIEITTDEQGTFDQTLFDEEYQVIVGSWGYQYMLIESDNFTDGQAVTYELSPGFEDNFALDLGWTVIGNATTGIWERDIPVPTFFNGTPSNVDEDIQGDIGSECYITGNAGGGAGVDDVDDGITRLLSPEFNVSELEDPILQYNAWFFIGGGNGPQNDTMFIRIWDKTNLTTLDMYTTSTFGWTDVVSIPLRGLVDTDADLSLSVVIEDQVNTGHLLEGGFDVFRIIDGAVSTTNTIAELDNIKIFPNPFSDNINIILEANDYKSIRLVDLMGRDVYSTKSINNQTVIETNLTPGFYNILIERNDGTLLSQKLIKQ